MTAGIWRVLLPVPRDGRLLYLGRDLDPALIEQAGSFREIVAATPDRTTAIRFQQSIKEAEVTNLDAACRLEISRLPVPDGTVDGIVLAPGWGEIFLAALPRVILKEIFRMLAPAGTVLLQTVQSLRSRLWSGVALASRDTILPDILHRSFLVKHGFVATRAFSVVERGGGAVTLVDLDGETVGEELEAAIPGSGMKVAVKRELSRRPMWAPLLHVVLSRREGESLPYERVRETVCRSLPGGRASGALEVSAGGNLAMHVTASEAAGRIEIPTDPEQARREAHNAETLEALAGRAPVPRVLTKGSLEGLTFCLEEVLPGAPLLDVLRRGPAPVRERARAEAIDFLGKLHGATATLDETARARRRARIEGRWNQVERLVSRSPEDLQIFLALRDWHRGEWNDIDEDLPVVQGHGDFGPQNILVDPGDGALCGVIDWDLGDDVGSPWIDLAHLVVCERWKVDGAGLAESIESVLFGEDTGWRREPAVSAYRAVVPIPERAEIPLAVQTWVDWVAPHARTERARDGRWIESNVLALLRTAPWRRHVGEES